jgi:hypothetical protein
MPIKPAKAPEIDEEKDEFDDIDEELDNDPKKSDVPSVEEVDDPLDDESVEEAAPATEATQTEETAVVEEPEAPVAKKGPKINFEYQDPGEDLSNPSSKQREATLEDLANKYKESQRAEVEAPAEQSEVVQAESGGEAVPAQNYAEAEETAGEFEDEKEDGKEIPRMRAQMPSSGVYSTQGRGSGELYQTPYMKSSFNKDDNVSAKPKSSSKLHFVILTAIGLAVLASAVYLLKYQFKTAKPLPSPTPAPTTQAVATPSPSPTPAPIDRSKYTIRVLNGTGKSGLAKTVADKLTGLGYKLDKTGNAPSADSTTIKAQKGNDDLIKQLTTDLAPDYTASSDSAALKSTDNADAEVTLGGK